MSKYGIVMAYSEEDAGFVAIAPELSGCTAFGATEEEALAEIKTAIQFWLDKAQREARPVPQPRGKTLFGMIAGA